MGEKKLCKYCKSEIDKKAKICPFCKRGQGNVVLRLLFVFIIITFVITVLASLGDSSNSTSNEKKTVNMGEKVTVNDVDYIVNEKKIQKEISVASGYFKYTADGNYLLINITITNNSKSSINIDSTDFRLKDENGATYSASILTSVDNMDMLNFETINPNATESGYIAYDIANTDLHYTLTIDGDEFFDSAGIEVSIQ
ncbi:putative uncharacterized protein [Firmicutes bacterium CAG:822]|nr:putative uncharacterized protein [Firmicutes bacterium CAG:822]